MKVDGFPLFFKKLTYPHFFNNLIIRIDNQIGHYQDPSKGAKNE